MDFSVLTVIIVLLVVIATVTFSAEWLSMSIDKPDGLSQRKRRDAVQEEKHTEYVIKEGPNGFFQIKEYGNVIVDGIQTFDQALSCLQILLANRD